MINTFLDRQSQFYLALWQHLQLTFFALLIASLIAIPLAIYVSRHARLVEWLLQATSSLQTIPSLALLGLLIPLVGIGFMPALIALSVYALLPIFQNSYLGLKEVDPGLVEAGRALGLSRFEILRSIELPLAKPAIIAGIRLAAVTTIGTATLAALVGGGGLGDFILLGIDRNNTNLIIIGALASTFMAILIGWLINQTTRLPKQLAIAMLAVVSFGMITATAWPALASGQQDRIVIAGKLGSEPEILINMYQDLIKQSDPKAQVTLKANFGKTSFLFSALKSDKISLYPEFTGTITQTLAKEPIKLPTGSGAVQTYQAAKKAMAAQQLTLLKPLAYNNTYGIAVKKSLALQYHMKNISDLINLPNPKAGMTGEFLDRPDGWPGLVKNYHLPNIPTISMDPDLRYQALNDNQSNLVDAYTTDSQLAQYHLVVLKDQHHFFPVYQGAPLMKTRFAKSHPKIVSALNHLAGHITQVQMQHMNYLVNVRHYSPARVAKHYLKVTGLLR
ncbi:ABC transporter permease/substrate-binding protein [Oenococcus sp.]|uniref:ABC transporter permease/substrate-binding protein n=1 Tax=Oenococcus sp. TaxID=1979414 RepID=UPI0039E84F65